MANLTPAELARLATNEIDPVNDLGLVWDASATVLKAVAVGSLTSTGIVNAVAAGIDNTGATPMSDALNGLLAGVEATGGGIVFLPPGVYRNDKLIQVGNNTTLLGAGRGATVIRSDASVEGFNGAYGSVGCIGKRRASIRSLTVDHATNSASTNGICLWPGDPETATGVPSSFCSIIDCEVLGFNSHQYLIWNRNANDTLIAFNHLNGGVPAYVEGSQQEGIEIFGGRRVTVTGNQVRNVGNAGIYPVTGDFPGHLLQDILIAGNSVFGCRAGIAGLSSFGAANGTQILDRVQIRGNTVQRCWRLGIALTHAGGGEPAGTVVMRDVLVDGNTVNCENTGASPMAFVVDLGPSATTEGCLFTGNVFAGGQSPAGENGGAVSAYWAHNTAWRGNSIRTAVATSHGVYVYRSNNVAFEANDVTGAGLSALVLDHVDGSRVVGNRFAGWNTGDSGQNAIPMYAVTNTVIAGNSFVQSGPASTFCVQGSDEDCSGIIVSGNFPQYPVADGVPEPLRAPGANANRGEVVMPAGEGYVTVENSRVHDLVPVQVTQVDGTPAPFVVRRSAGQFSIVRLATARSARYCWSIGD